MVVRVELRNVIYALADALDLVGMDDLGHGKRVGIMAAECCRVLGMDDASRIFHFDLGLLHDIGVSSTRTHRCLVTEFDWEGAEEHCLRGEQLLRGFAPLARMATPVRYHHTRWEKLVARGVAPEVAKQANLILLMDRIDALTAACSASHTSLQHAASVREQVRQRSGTYFAPELVEAFLEVSRSEAFWLQLEPRAIQLYLQDMLQQGVACEVGVGELRQLAGIFAQIVDAKSSFTAEHSEGVAAVARLLAARMGLSAERCDQIEIAGLLHDIGKLRIPDEILDKPGGLDALERQEMNTHSFETYQILRHIEGFEEIARWAAYHHEEPGGTGYPFHLHGETLPLEARILRVADIFQAMVQERPYRAGLSPAEVADFMRSLIVHDKVDGEIAGALLNGLDDALSVARVRQSEA